MAEWIRTQDSDLCCLKTLASDYSSVMCFSINDVVFSNALILRNTSKKDFFLKPMFVINTQFNFPYLQIERNETLNYRFCSLLKTCQKLRNLVIVYSIKYKSFSLLKTSSPSLPPFPIPYPVLFSL